MNKPTLKDRLTQILEEIPLLLLWVLQTLSAIREVQ
jgi:hypothetical protein